MFAATQTKERRPHGRAGPAYWRWPPDTFEVALAISKMPLCILMGRGSLYTVAHQDQERAGEFLGFKGEQNIRVRNGGTEFSHAPISIR